MVTTLHHLDFDNVTKNGYEYYYNNMIIITISTLGELWIYL